MNEIRMVDLHGQYERIKTEIDSEIQKVIDSGRFIRGPVVKQFEKRLSEYLKVAEVISCANGTDALQIALMALDLSPGDEVIVPAFTYAAPVEVAALLHLIPVMVDVDPWTFNMRPEQFHEAITEKTRAVIPVNLFGQSADVEGILHIANKYDISVVEDNAQAIGSETILSNGRVVKSGTIGHIGCTSFFPSKNLGCYGDGGAIYTSDPDLAKRIRMIANHGQRKKYYHSIIGVNSRLDAIQAAILNVKLKYLDTYSEARQNVANAYDIALAKIKDLISPSRAKFSTHVFHQYTLRIQNNLRDQLKEYLRQSGIPSMIYYPLPLYRQEAFMKYYEGVPLPNTELLCQEVLSLPIHTEMDTATLEFILSKIEAFFNEC